MYPGFIATNTALNPSGVTAPMHFGDIIFNPSCEFFLRSYQYVIPVANYSN